MFLSSNQEVIRLYVSMDYPFLMNFLNTLDLKYLLVRYSSKDLINISWVNHTICTAICKTVLRSNFLLHS